MVKYFINKKKTKGACKADMNGKETSVKGEQLLQNILRADAEAREMTSSALAEKASSHAALAEEKAELRRAYEAETKTLLLRLREAARKSTDSKLDAIETEKIEKLRRLDELSASRTAAWVEQICAAVLRG